MMQVRQTAVFRDWLRALRDANAVARIVARLRRLEMGNFGDVKPIGSSVWEMRIDYGPGYRVYYTRRSAVLILLLCGGDKRSQRRDIKRAEALAAETRSKGDENDTV